VQTQLDQPVATTVSGSQSGRPTRSAVYITVATEVAELKRQFGGLPPPGDAAPIWRNVWFEEVHNSTALEGNVLARREVEKLLAEDKAVGGKALRNYLEVRGYADAAQWVYKQARGKEAWVGDRLLTITEVREVHRLTVGPLWEVQPPANALPEETPGNWRRHDIEKFEQGMSAVPFVEIPQRMSDWIRRAGALRATPEIWEHLASLHAEFERIHPFLDGNGRTGRLVMNLALVRLGYPPAVIYKRRRDHYLRALQSADKGEGGPLGEFLARAVLLNLTKFIYPAMARREKLVPLESLATGEVSSAALRQAAMRGRLRAVRGDTRSWRSTKAWVRAYLDSKYATLKQPKGQSYQTRVRGEGQTRIAIRTSTSTR
jgi:fido (protein-threonine AMPylation protein)